MTEADDKKKRQNIWWAVGITGASLLMLLMMCIIGTVILTVNRLNEQKGTLNSVESTPTTEVPKRETRAPENVVPLISAQELSRLYNSNEVAANEQFKNKRIRVIGVIEDIKENLWGTPYVSLAGQDFMQSVRCSFGEESRQELSSLASGRQITIEGRVSGMILLNVQMEDCKIVDR